MIPNPDEMLFCIMQDGGIADGANGLAIGTSEMEAWRRLLEPLTHHDVERAKDSGCTVVRCAIMVLNP